MVLYSCPQYTRRFSFDNLKSQIQTGSGRIRFRLLAVLDLLLSPALSLAQCLIFSRCASLKNQNISWMSLQLELYRVLGLAGDGLVLFASSLEEFSFWRYRELWCSSLGSKYLRIVNGSFVMTISSRREVPGRAKQNAFWDWQTNSCWCGFQSMSYQSPYSWPSSIVSSAIPFLATCNWPLSNTINKLPMLFSSTTISYWTALRGTTFWKMPRMLRMLMQPNSWWLSLMLLSRKGRFFAQTMKESSSQQRSQLMASITQWEIVRASLSVQSSTRLPIMSNRAAARLALSPRDDSQEAVASSIMRLQSILSPGWARNSKSPVTRTRNCSLTRTSTQTRGCRCRGVKQERRARVAAAPQCLEQDRKGHWSSSQSSSRCSVSRMIDQFN